MTTEEIKCDRKNYYFSILQKICSLDFYLKLHTCKWGRDILMAGFSHDSDRQLFIYLQK